MLLNKENNFNFFLYFLFLSFFLIFCDINYLKNSKIKFISKKVNYLINDFRNNIYIFFKEKKKLLLSKNYLINKNLKLIRENLLLRSKINFINNFKRENYILRNYLNIPLLKKNDYSIVRVLLNNSVNVDELFINIYNIKNLKYGNLLFNGIGIIGKLINLNNSLGKIQLICNYESGFPGKILRTGLNVIINGFGCKRNMKIFDLPIDTNIIKGDIIVNYDTYKYYNFIPIGVVIDIINDDVYGGIIVIVKSFLNYTINNNNDYGVLFK